jgi:hypothetical protein
LLFFLAGFDPTTANAGLQEGVDITFQGQLSGWTRHFRRDGAWEHQSGLRYLPGVRIEQTVAAASVLDLEFTANAVAATGSGPDDDVQDMDAYRATLRYSTPRTDTSLGLQKIAFGPTRLLRPLRWFDRIDPTDPLQFTDGVYALRFRYNTLSNANAWLWCLMYNDDPKGNELLGSVRDQPEWGARFQMPALDGELAATVHFRRVDGSGAVMDDYSERRYALDGRWDLGIGLWFEAVLEDRTSSGYSFGWVKRIALGTDYTFNWGNGLYALFEHMAVIVSEEARGRDEEQSVSALQLDYPVNVMDTVKAYGIFQWETEKMSCHLNWQRTYDNLIISVGLFDYPETRLPHSGFSQREFASGTGGEIVLIFNH